MPELSDLLHRSVDDVDVPRPDVHRISARGRSLRTRRRLGTAVAAAVLLGAVGGGLALTGPLGGDTRGADVTQRPDSPTAYDAWSAWSFDDKPSIGGLPVDLPGMTFHLAQTSVGVVASVFPGDDEPARQVLVRPDGSTRRLSVPDTPIVDGDINAPRVAWLESRTDTLVLHVWDVAKDEELARVDVPSPGTTPQSGEEVITTVLLDGDGAYFSTADGIPHRVAWRTGEVEDLDLLPVSVRSGVTLASDGASWKVLDTATGQVRRTLEGDELSGVSLSPDGRWLFGSRSDGTTFVEPTDGGDRVLLDEDLSSTASWSRDGAIVGQKGSAPTMLRCTTDGTCTERVIGEGEDVFVLSADYLNAG